MTKFLFCRSCPASLEASLTRAVLDEARSPYLNPAGTPTGGGGVDTTDSSVDNLASNTDIDLSSSNNSKGNNTTNHF